MSKDLNPLPPVPTAPPPGVVAYENPYQCCPGCGGGPLEEPSFTWWGGLVGHKMLGVHKCRTCRHWWVKSTGRPGDARVTAYATIGIVLGVLFVIGYLLLP